jgi:hypothetical protein
MNGVDLGDHLASSLPLRGNSELASWRQILWRVNLLINSSVFLISFGWNESLWQLLIMRYVFVDFAHWRINLQNCVFPMMTRLFFHFSVRLPVGL